MPPLCLHPKLCPGGDPGEDPRKVSAPKKSLIVCAVMAGTPPLPRVSRVQPGSLQGQPQLLWDIHPWGSLSISAASWSSEIVLQLVLEALCSSLPVLTCVCHKSTFPGQSEAESDAAHQA